MSVLNHLECDLVDSSERPMFGVVTVSTFSFKLSM